MSSLTKEEKRSRQERLTNKLLWLPLILIVAVVPLIVRMMIINIDGTVGDILNRNWVSEAYAGYKSTALIILGVTMAVFLFLFLDKEKIKWDRTIAYYAVGGGLFIGISLLATVLSENKHTAWWGMPDRAEGFMMILCYVLITAYTLYALHTKKNYFYILIALSFLIIVTTIIGAFQYFGYDLFTNVPFFKQLLLGKEGMGEGMVLSADYTSGKVIGTMFHYNYVGSFGAMIVPLFTILTLFIKGKKQKLACAMMTLCSLFILFGSTSRAGLIGLIVSVIFMVIIFGKKIVTKWHFTLPVAAVLGAILLGFNALTGGTIFSRIPTMLTESLALLKPVEESFNYLDHIPVRGAEHIDNEMKIVFQQHTLYIGNDEGNITLKDENLEPVAMMPALMQSGMVYTIADERFKDIYFKLENVDMPSGEKPPVAFTMVYQDQPTFHFILDDVKGVVMSDVCPIQEMEIEYPETIGFKGKEKLGSARGYIWSRSLPMMKKTALVGYGPDTYALKFPQNDLLGKWWAYGTPNMIVDKPHNLYLGIWINQGGLALLGFLIVIGAYILQSLKLYAFKNYYNEQAVLGSATFCAIVGYLGAGIFNDSIVAVTPIFCVLLGAGMAINFKNNQDSLAA